MIADTHGDYVSAQRALADARGNGGRRRFVALGDYIDRATLREPHPVALPNGSLANLCFLLANKLLAPREIVLLQGNHEAARRLPIPGPSYLGELREHFGRDDARVIWEKSLQAVERLPLAAVTANGVFLAHGGIPPDPSPDPEDWRRDDLRLAEGLLWGDPAHGYEDRRIGFPFDAPDLDRFLARVGASVFLRGHDPKHLGAALYDGRVLTLSTSDIFARLGHGGILMAEIPPRSRISTVRDLPVWDLRGERWVPYPIHEPH